MNKMLNNAENSNNEYLNQLLTSFDFKIIYHTITDTIFQKFNFDGSFFSILTSSGNEFKTVMLREKDKNESYSYSLLTQTMPILNKGIMYKCLIKNHLIFYAEAVAESIDTVNGNRYIQLLNMKSLLHVPLFRNNRPFGILSFYSKDKQISLSTEDLSEIEYFLKMVAPYMLHSFKYYTLIEQAEEIEILTGISNNISTDFDHEKVIDSVLNYMKVFYGFEGAYLSLVNKEKTSFSVVSIRVNEKYTEARFKIIGETFPLISGDTRTADCILNNKQYFFTGITPEIIQAIKSEPNKRIAELFELKTVLHLPVWAGDEPLGSFTLFTHDKSIYLNEDDFQSIQRFVNQLAITIRNSQILAELRKKNSELESLNDITREISSAFDYNVVLEKIVNFMMETYQFEGCGLYLVTEDKKMYSFVRGFFPAEFQCFIESIRGVCLELNVNMGWVPECILKNTTSYHIDLTKESNIDEANKRVANFLKIKTVLNMPITVGNEVIGAFSLTTHNKIVYLSDEDILSIQRFVNQIAVILKNSKLYTEIQQKTAELEEKDKIISEDLFLAEKIQKSIFDSIDKTVSGLEIHTYYKPLMAVGGDIYDIFEIKPGYIRCFIADAAGHGVQAALTTMMIKSEYDKIKEINLMPGDIINQLNDVFFTKFLNLNVFFSCCILDFNISQNEMYYSSAGHPVQILISGDEIICLKAAGRIVGIVQEAHSVTITYPLKRRDKILLFTDGIFEEFSDIQNELGVDGLMEIVRTVKDQPIDIIIDTTLSEIKKWRGVNPVNDDATIIGIYHP